MYTWSETISLYNPRPNWYSDTIDLIIIILVRQPEDARPSNRTLPMPGTADGDAISRCQVLGRAGSVHHGAGQWMLHGLPDATVTRFSFVWKSPL